jgi:hypothetical protein
MRRCLTTSPPSTPRTRPANAFYGCVWSSHSPFFNWRNENQLGPSSGAGRNFLGFVSTLTVLSFGFGLSRLHTATPEGHEAQRLTPLNESSIRSLHETSPTKSRTLALYLYIAPSDHPNRVEPTNIDRPRWLFSPSLANASIRLNL